MNAENILTLINGYMANIRYDRKPLSLYEPIKYVLSIGGKRIRPTLMLMAYNLYKDDVEKILPCASAIETYHNFTLLHDDLMDKADMRRGMPTVHKKWDDNTAILSGDTMLILAFQRMSQCESPYLHDVITTFTETVLEIDEGQQYDIEFESRDDVREEEYIEMIRLKTSVLLACALKIGAILGGASESDQQNLYEFGLRIGLAFQLQDDYLDVYGDAKVFGKNIGGDIVSNKKTYMLINALNKAEGDDRELLNKWISCDADLTIEENKGLRDEKVGAITSLYTRLGIDSMAKERMNRYYEEAHKYIDDVDVPEERKQELIAYAKKMMHRNS